jgi:peptidoglycan/xylan/chitin deacetylase (PgdA/CDA1 family)
MSGRNRSLAVLLIGAAFLLAAPDARAAQAGGEGDQTRYRSGNRGGIVVLQFDDGTIGHYTHAFRILEKCKLKGSFGVVTGALGKPGRLTAEQVVEMHRAGHEIHDHTLDHNAAFWGDPKNRAQWKVQIEQSLGILKQLGIQTRGWNQPGGRGQNWTRELRDTLAPYYDYVAGRVGLKLGELCNMHWRLKDDPFCLGYGGVAFWNSSGGKEGAAKEAARACTQIADGLQQGLVTISLWHVIRDEDGSAWGLEEVCKFLRAHDLPVMRMADAVKAVQDPRKHFDPQVEQMPNPRFLDDLDQNGRPDGYLGCRYAPPEVRAPDGGRVAEFADGTTTWLYGPEPGQTRFALTIRSADAVVRTLTPTLTFAEIGGNYEYRWKEKQRCGPIRAGTEWQTTEIPIEVGRDVDRVKVEFEILPPGRVYVGKLSWRIMPSAPGRAE